MDKEELELKERIKVLKQEELVRRKQLIIQKKDVVTEKKRESTAIYVSNLPKLKGLQEKLTDEFSRFGIIARDQDGNHKCKLYKDEKGEIKGDALIIYARHESVPVAIDLMNGYSFQGSNIKVEEATFKNEKKRQHEDINDEGDKIQDIEIPTKLPKLITAEINEDSSDDDDGNEERLARTVVITNIFGLIDEVDKEELEDIKVDILQGCKRVGPVEKIKWSKGEGKAHVLFQLPSDARKCYDGMNGRLFDGRKLIVYMNEDCEENSAAENELFTEDDLIEL